MLIKRITVVAVLLLCFLPCFPQNSVKFAFLTDIHLSPRAESEQNLINCVDEINKRDFDLIIVTGDISNTGSDAELNAVKNALDRLTKPVYVITGNHETNWSESAGLTFKKLWGDDKFVFEYGNFLFIGFSTGPYMKMGNGHVKEEDIFWLEEQLASRNLSGKNVVFAAHYPLTEDMDNWLKITEILNRYGVKIDLCGHEHRISIHNFDGIIGLMGRATVASAREKGGYNIVEIRSDSVYFSQTVTGSGKDELFAAFSLKNKDVIKGLPTSPPTDYSINNQYQNVKILTSIQDSSSIYTGVAVGKNNIYYADSKGIIHCVNLKNNSAGWIKQITGPIYATPVLVKKTLCIGSIDGFLYGFDPETGKEIWRLEFDKPIIAEGIAENDFLYIGAGSNFYKINAQTGKIVWEFTEPTGQLQGQPAISGNRIIFGAWDTNLYCLDKTTGKALWKWNNGKSQVLFSPANVHPTIFGGIVYIVAPDRYMTAIELNTGKQLWRNNDFTFRESMGMSADGKTVYAKIMNDSVLAVSATGNGFHLDWAVNAGFGYEHNPCPVVEYKNIVYAGGKGGLLTAIDRKTHQVVWMHKCGNSAINKITPDPHKGVWVSLIEGKALHLE